MAFKPYNNYKRDTKYYNQTSNKQNINAGNIKVFGFRSGTSYKMIPAMLYYILAGIYVFSGIWGELKYFQFESMDYILFAFKYIFIIVLAYSPIIFLSDFKYIDSLPFFKKKQLGSTLIGLILVSMFCTFMIFVDKMCVSDTYIKSADAYYAQVMEKQSEKLEEQQTTSIDKSQITTNKETTSKK